MLWIDVHDSVFQLPQLSSNFDTAFEEEWDNKQQPSQPYAKVMCLRCMRQRVGLPDTNMFSDLRP